MEIYKDRWEDHNFHERSALRISKNDDGSYLFFANMDNTYLHNELLHRKDAGKEAAKFAYKWGLVLIALGMLEELKKQGAETQTADGSDEDEYARVSLEEQVSRFSSGVAAVIIPTILNLMEVMGPTKGTSLAVAS